MPQLKRLFGSALAILCLMCTSCDDYSRFKHHNAEYYAGLAAECDSLLARGPAESIPEARVIARQTNSLPPTIRQLAPSHIQIWENGVQLLVGSYNVIWTRSKDDERLWKLIAYREGHSKTLYSLRKPN
jgi:hypothetical protein